MPPVRIKGINRVRRRAADGSIKTYFYAWKGGPALTGEPGSPEFEASYEAAKRAAREPDSGSLAGLARRYEASPEFQKNAATTKAEWSRWLERIRTADIGQLSLAALDDKRVRGDLLEWRDGYADRPRTADYGMQVLSRVLSFGVDRGLLERNAVARAKHLYESDRADQIWTPDDIAAFVAKASPPLGRALRLACATGFRRSDLVALTWDDVGDIAIVRPTSKSRGRRVATVPRLLDVDAILNEIDCRGEHVLLNSRGRPWTADGLESSFIKTRDAAGLSKRLHDARGTFVTRLRLAGLSSDEIADVVGWKKKDVERLLAAYVDREAIVRSLSERLRRNEKR